MSPEQEARVLALLDVLETDGTVIRFKPAGHQRMALGPTGLSISDIDPDPRWWGSGNVFVNGRAGFGAATNWTVPAGDGRRDLSATGAGGFPARVTIEEYHDQAALQVWSGDTHDDGLASYAIFATTADSHRPRSQNVVIRADAVNFNETGGGTARAVDARTFGEPEKPPMPIGLAYPSDPWSRAYWLTLARLGAEPSTTAIFFGRCLYDIGANTDSRPAGDVDFYATKHLTELKAALGLP